MQWNYSFSVIRQGDSDQKQQFPTLRECHRTLCETSQPVTEICIRPLSFRNHEINLCAQVQSNIARDRGVQE